MAQMIWDSLGPLFIMFIGIVISQMVRNGQGVRRVWTVLDTLPDQMRAAWNGTDARLQGLRPDTQPPPCSMPINPDARLRFRGEEDGVDLQERFILGRDRRFQSDGASAPFICWPVQGAPYVVAVCADSYEDGIAWWQDCVAAAAFSALYEAEVFLFDPGATPQSVSAELRMQAGQSHDAIVALLEQIRLEISVRQRWLARQRLLCWTPECAPALPPIIIAVTTIHLLRAILGLAEFEHWLTWLLCAGPPVGIRIALVYTRSNQIGPTYAELIDMAVRIIPDRTLGEGVGIAAWVVQPMPIEVQADIVAQSPEGTLSKVA